MFIDIPKNILYTYSVVCYPEDREKNTSHYLWPIVGNGPITMFPLVCDIGCYMYVSGDMVQTAFLVISSNLKSILTILFGFVVAYCLSLSNH